ncbi:ATP-grasp fold amidoligase family protein [Enterocloster lavalensis]|uniref:ATP-grasp fold amidoligase family protein n=1 Tax=Enterocloster lavalensis TaxID=460384 RepID=UPI002E8E026A|nr:ATP-grasp fold amidoligase family protein [Enterocloster lavalensis]
MGVWDSFDDINFDSLPDQFVLKCTHDSEGIVLVKDKSLMDKAAAKEKITAALRQNFYYIGREWPYKNIKPRIIAEPYLIDDETGELRDYKFFCFDGEPKALYIASDRSIDDVKFDFFDLDFNHLGIKQKYPNASTQIKKPNTFDEMIELSRKLSKGFAHVRVDLYEVNGKVYFGELTFYHFSGFMPFQPDKWDKIFGEWLKLPAAGTT